MDYDLISEIQQKTNDLQVAIRSLRKTGQRRAETERDYKILLRQEALKLIDGVLRNHRTFDVSKIRDDM